MAAKFEKGKHIFFLFKNGRTVQDSQLSPRYYLERSRAEQYLPYGGEIVEYAPVVHAQWVKHWCDNNMLGHEYEECSNCGTSMVDTNQFWDCECCPNCGAKMDGERKTE